LHENKILIYEKKPNLKTRIKNEPLKKEWLVLLNE